MIFLKFEDTARKTVFFKHNFTTSANYKKLLLNKANLLAISGYIWKNKKLKPIEAIKKLK